MNCVFLYWLSNSCCFLDVQITLLLREKKCTFPSFPFPKHFECIKDEIQDHVSFY